MWEGRLLWKTEYLRSDDSVVEGLAGERTQRNAWMEVEARDLHVQVVAFFGWVIALERLQCVRNYGVKGREMSVDVGGKGKAVCYGWR